MVVLVPELPKTHVYGFTRWLTSNKALVQLSLRYKTDDILWFTFFHEAAHILLHGKKDIFFEFRGVDNEKEDAANRWAANFLIPEKDWEQFCQNTEATVLAGDGKDICPRAGHRPPALSWAGCKGKTNRLFSPERPEIQA